MTDTTKKDPHAELMRLCDKYAESGMQVTLDTFVNKIDPIKAKCDHLARYEAIEAYARTMVADSARYQWLRMQTGQKSADPESDELSCCICVDQWTGSLGKTLSGEKLDFAIDAAMNKETS